MLITPGKVDQPLYSRLWGSGFLPARHQGVQFRSGGDPVLYLANPDGVSPESRRALLDRLHDLHAHAAAQLGDADVDARIAQYEMAFRMQASVPGVMDVSRTNPKRPSLSTVRTRASRARSRPTACWHAGWPSAA